jgi:NTE family protein
MNTTFSGERALVLGGGGSSGNAWEIGVVAGLYDSGLDVTEADLIVGTSAGSTTGAQITATRPAELFAAVLGAASVPARRGPNTHMTDLLAKTSAIIADADDAAAMRRGMGAAALEIADSAASGQRRATVAARLPSQDWPERQLLRITAVDARTGEPAVFDRFTGVELVDAVTASCAGPGAPPHPIGEHRYIDGGYRRNENADLAAGYARVLVLSPFGGRSRHPAAWGMDLATQVDELRAHGSRVETVFPDSDAEHMFGANAIDLSLRVPVARAGYDQGKALAERLTEFWR